MREKWFLENQQNRSSIGYSVTVTFNTEIPHKWCENNPSHCSVLILTHFLRCCRRGRCCCCFFMWNDYRCACFSLDFYCFLCVFFSVGCMHNWRYFFCFFWVVVYALFTSYRWPTITTQQIFKFKCSVLVSLSVFFLLLPSLSFSRSNNHSLSLMWLKNSSVCNPFEFRISLQHNRLHVLSPYDMWKCAHTLSNLIPEYKYAVKQTNKKNTIFFSIKCDLIRNT